MAAVVTTLGSGALVEALGPVRLLSYVMVRASSGESSMGYMQ